MTRFRPLWFEQFEQRLLLTSGVDASIEFPTETPGNAVSEAIEESPSAQFRLELSDLVGQPITSVQAGEEFYLSAYVTDLRSKPQGVFAAYLDLAFDAGRTVPAGDVEFGSVYKNGRDSGGSVPGLLDEVGGFSGSIRPLGAGEFLLFRAPFRADTAGTASFLTEPATSMPRSVVLLYGEYAPLASDRIDFGSTSLDVLEPRDSSLEDSDPPAPSSWDVGNLGPPASTRLYESAQAQAFPPSILLTEVGADLLPRDPISVLGNPIPADLRTDRVWDRPTACDLLDLKIGFPVEFNFTVRGQRLASKWGDRELFRELDARRPIGRSFSLMDTPDFSYDDDDAGAGDVWAADDRVGRSTNYSSLFHDHYWLAAGLLRIGWTTELGRNEDAALVDDREMFDLGQMAYEIARTIRPRDSRINGDDDDGDEWLVRLDRAFSEETEIVGKQGIMTALDMGMPPQPSPRQEAPSQKAASRRDSGEAAPTDNRNNKRAEDNPERKAHDDTTPAA